MRIALLAAIALLALPAGAQTTETDDLDKYRFKQPQDVLDSVRGENAAAIAGADGEAEKAEGDIDREEIDAAAARGGIITNPSLEDAD